MKARRVVVPVRQSLRAYWGTAVLLASTGAAALAVLVPAAALVGPGAGLPVRLAVPVTGGADFGVAWGQFMRTPDAIRAAALTGLAHLLFGVAAGVVAVAWLSTMSLSTARATARAGEAAIRRSVGARRLDLLASALLEGGAIAAVALVIGGVTGLVAARVALGAWPGSAGPAAVGPGVLAVGVTLAGIVLGALLSLAAARPGARLVVAEEAPLGLAVPVVQLGLSLTVLVVGSLLGRGAEATGAGTVRASGQVVEVTTRGATAALRSRAYAAALADLAGDATVSVASLGSRGLITGLGPVDVTETDCGQCRWDDGWLEYHTFFAVHFLVSADSFRALGLPVLAGRGFTSADRWGGPRVAVVSRTLERLHFQPSGALGRTLHLGHDPDGNYTVVGVVADRRPVGLGGADVPLEAVYLSVLQHPAPAVELLVRSARPGGDGAASRALQGALGPRLAGVTRMSEAGLLNAEAAPLRWFARLVGGTGWALLLLSVIGTFAVMWLWVSALLRELGVRRAIGARRRDVLRFVLARAAVVALAGVAFGTWAGMMAWDALTAAVAGLPAWDPRAVAGYGVLLVVATIAGALLPAWRAARATPARLLAGP